jgi:hypothetical protein
VNEKRSEPLIEIQKVQQVDLNGIMSLRIKLLEGNIQKPRLYRATSTGVIPEKTSKTRKQNMGKASQ